MEIFESFRIDPPNVFYQIMYEYIKYLVYKMILFSIILHFQYSFHIFFIRCDYIWVQDVYKLSEKLNIIWYNY